MVMASVATCVTESSLAAVLLGLGKKLGSEVEWHDPALLMEGTLLHRS